MPRSSPFPGSQMFRSLAFFPWDFMSFPATREDGGLRSPDRILCCFFRMSSQKEDQGFVSSVQSLSRARLCDATDRGTPGLRVRHQLPELAQTPVP